MTKTREIEPLCLTVIEAARAIRRDEAEVRRWVNQGLIGHVRWTPTSHPLIPAEVLRQFVRDHTVLTPASTS